MSCKSRDKYNESNFTTIREKKFINRSWIVLCCAQGDCFVYSPFPDQRACGSRVALKKLLPVQQHG